MLTSKCTSVTGRYDDHVDALKQYAIRSTAPNAACPGLHWNMAQGSKIRQFHGLAALHGMERQKILPRNYRNPKRSHESNTKECAINQTQTHNMGTNITVPSRRTNHITTHGQESVRCIDTSIRRMRTSIFLPDRPISHAIPTWQQKHHGHGRNRQQCDLGQTHH